MAALRPMSYVDRHNKRIERHDKRFEDAISFLLNYAGVPPMRVKAMINDPNIFHLFCIAFTHEDVHRQENIDEYGEVYFPKSKIDYGNSYETLETIGDGSINKAITWYYQQAYPKLRISGNLSKVKAYMGSNIAIAEHFTSYFKLTQFLIAPPKIFDNPPVKIVGDITESFLGALEVAIEYKWGVGAGGVYGM